MEDLPIHLMESDISLVPNETCNTGLRRLAERELGIALVRLGRQFGISEDKLVEFYQSVKPIQSHTLTDNMMCAGCRLRQEHVVQR